MNIDGWGKVFKTNVAAPALMAQVYLPLVEMSEKKTIVNVSSSLGAFGYGYGETWASYAITKTALNMLVRPSFPVDLPHAILTDPVLSHACRRTSRTRSGRT